MTQSNTELFAGQVIYCGIDVHKKQWNICVYHCGREIAHFVTSPDPSNVAEQLQSKYPGATINSAYEAGFSGFEAHRILTARGINNIVINAADVPTMGKERSFKSDKIDCRKIARSLANNSLEPIYIPSREQLRLRNLVRYETQLVRHISSVKNQLKSFLYFNGMPVPKSIGNPYLRKAEAQARSTNNYTLLGYVQLLNQLSELKKETVKNEKKLIEVYNLSETIENLCSIPGIAFRSAVIILSELWDLKRFKTKAQLAAYVGLAPRVVGSGESEETVGAGNRKQKYLHYIFTEVAQRASRSDSEMASLYGKKIYQGLDNQQAVCVVAKKILFIIRAVCLDKRPYQVRLEKK